MGRLFKNELLKLKYSRTIWISMGAIAGMVILLACMPASLMGSDIMQVYGYTVAFTYMRNAGTFSIVVLAPIAAELFTKEFNQRTIHNILSCGVSRRKYFVVKMVCFFMMGLLSFLMALALLVIITTVRYRFFRLSYKILNYVLVNLVYHSCAFFVICTYMAFYIFVAVAFRKNAVIVYLSGVIAVMGEFTLMDLIPNYKGILPVVLDMYELLEKRRVLTPEFIKLMISPAAMFVIFMLLAYALFLKRDVN